MIPINSECRKIAQEHEDRVERLWADYDNLPQVAEYLPGYDIGNAGMHLLMWGHFEHFFKEIMLVYLRFVYNSHKLVSLTDKLIDFLCFKNSGKPLSFYFSESGLSLNDEKLKELVNSIKLYDTEKQKKTKKKRKFRDCLYDLLQVDPMEKEIISFNTYRVICSTRCNLAHGDYDATPEKDDLLKYKRFIIKDLILGVEQAIATACSKKTYLRDNLKSPE